MAISTNSEHRLSRCAIYTRKSVALGLDKPINSLETQRAVCRAYIQSQAHRNWVEIPQHYDDGGYSGGSLARPALQRLVSDIEAGRVDIVVIYKVDRLSRSLTDFVRLMDVLEKYGASFVSVTQTFDTSDSMGRLILNILLTFAQFERELSSERIRDRCAEKRRKGMFSGGMPPIGYLVKNRSGMLVPDPQRADVIRNLFLDLPNTPAAELGRRLEATGFKTLTFGCRRGNRNRQQRFSSSHILLILRNPIYAGYFRHNGQLVRSQVEPLVSLEQWQRVQQIIQERHTFVRDPVKNCLMGILHDELGRRMKVINPVGGQRNGRYYVSEAVGWARGYGVKKVHVRADQVEKLTRSTIEAFLADRVKLKEAVLSLGLYSDETCQLLRKGNLAARRLSLMDNARLREFLVAVVTRADVDRAGLRLLICTFELTRFLGWDGVGIFHGARIRPKGADRFRMLYAPACLICTRPEFAVPVKPFQNCDSHRDERLIEMLNEASELRDFMLQNRSQSIAELARERKMGTKVFARLLRLNYLAPDIQAAIVDGSQPTDLTASKVLLSALPIDWEQQRRLYGFPSPNP